MPEVLKDKLLSILPVVEKTLILELGEEFVYSNFQNSDALIDVDVSTEIIVAWRIYCEIEWGSHCRWDRGAYLECESSSEGLDAQDFEPTEVW